MVSPGLRSDITLTNTPHTWSSSTDHLIMSKPWVCLRDYWLWSLLSSLLTFAICQSFYRLHLTWKHEDWFRWIVPGHCKHMSPNSLEVPSFCTPQATKTIPSTIETWTEFHTYGCDCSGPLIFFNPCHGTGLTALLCYDQDFKSNLICIAQNPNLQIISLGFNRLYSCDILCP